MTSKSNHLKPNFQKFIAGTLYALPLLFFLVAYFGLTVTGEDIFQGAGNLSNNVAFDTATDISDAFNNNGRLTDMYARSIIDVFDYQFQFGPDTLFRLLDTAMATGIFYIMACIILGRKPRLNITDATVFCLSFVAVILTPHGRILYAGFSAIHNYMISAFIFVLFILPYARLVLRKPINCPHFLTILLPLLGVIFGMSAALTPIAFLIITIGYFLLQRQKPPLWAMTGLSGVIIGFVISNFFGAGAGNYSSNEIYTTTYDYIAFADIFNHIPQIFKHLLSNFGRVFLPTIILSVFMLILCKNPRQFFTKQFYQNLAISRRNLIIVMLAFSVILILGSFQVNAPLRLLLPAYLATLIAATTFFWPHIKIPRVLTFVAGTLALALLTTKIILTISYHHQTALVLDEIKATNEPAICVKKPAIQAKNLPLIYLGQEDMLVEWAMPAQIHNKSVTFCADV